MDGYKVEVTIQAIPTLFPTSREDLKGDFKLRGEIE